MTDIPKTICANRQYRNSRSDEEIWYNNFCTHPVVQYQPIINPVTGTTMYIDKNGCVSSRQTPYCRDINKGNCELYQEKKSLKSILTQIKDFFKMRDFVFLKE